MRFAPKPLVVGSPVAPNVADVASGLVVDWRPMPSGGEIAVVDGLYRLEVGRNSWAAFSGGQTLNSGTVHDARPKRAAVLALASHIVSRGEPSAGPVAARDRLVDALAKSPAPPAEEVAKIVEGRAVVWAWRRLHADTHVISNPEKDYRLLARVDEVGVGEVGVGGWKWGCDRIDSPIDGGWMAEGTATTLDAAKAAAEAAYLAAVK